MELQAGGQIFDTGLLSSSDGSKEFQVTGVKAYAGFVVHLGTVTAGSIAVGDELTCMVDYARRSLVAPNHTMTHVLNFALRKVPFSLFLNGMDG